MISAMALASVVSMATTGCAAESDDDVDDGGESEDYLLAGNRLKASAVAAHLRHAGFAESMIGKMVCTAKYESNFYERASNKNRNGTIDRGLFQINSINLGLAGCPSRSGVDALWDPATNATCAFAIYKAQGINAWYGYRRHKSECDAYPAPASSSVSSSSKASNNAGDESDDGGCWSATLQDMVDARSCVQSKSNGVWFQCINGSWSRGANASSGPSGKCSASHPL